MKLNAKYTVAGKPLLGTYAASSMEDLALVKEAAMNVVIGGRELLNPETPEGRFLLDNGIKVLLHLTHHIYGMPRLGDRIDAIQTEIPLFNPSKRVLPSPGTVQVEEELIRYESFEEGMLRGCARGFGATKPSSHHGGIFLFLPEECAREIKEVKDSPNLLGYYVLDDSPGDALSALKAMYATIRYIEGGDEHHVVCAGYGDEGSLCNFAPGVCDMMLIYWYPVAEWGYDRLSISQQVQWMLTTARSRVPGIPFAGVYQAFWGDGAARPTAQQLREQAEDFVREGASGLVAFACRIPDPWGGWADAPDLRDELRRIHGEILSTGGLGLTPEPVEMAMQRIQPAGFWESPKRIPGLVPAYYIVGPFDDPEEGALRTVCPPDEGIDLEASYRGKHGPVRWVRRTTQSGCVGLGDMFGDQRLTAKAIAYATCDVETPEEREALVRLGSDDDVLVRLNDKEVWRHEGVRGLKRDQDTFPVTLPGGKSTFLLKVCNRKGMWGFVMRFTEPDGTPMEGLSFSP